MLIRRRALEPERTPYISCALASLLALTASATVAGSGCLQHPVKSVDFDPSQSIRDPLPLDPQRDVDVLFVIDNSGSMAQEQARLAQNFASLIGELEADDVRANYRIAITTTDTGNPNPACQSSAKTPEDGAFRLSACRERLDEFTNAFGDDEQVTACLSICDANAAQALAGGTLPTFTEADNSAKPRPWIESVEGTLNLPGDVSAQEAFECFAPQGVNGCGFESPLQAASRALERMVDASDPAYGFMRTNAPLLIVFVTDEADCSYQQVAGINGVFANGGAKVFWEDPTGAAATSSICWNAGVSCTGSPGGYDSCVPVDRAVDGGAAATNNEAVLTPVAEFVEQLEIIRAQKKVSNPDAEVFVSAIVGVPVGYNGNDIDIVYKDEDAPPLNPGIADPAAEQRLFGIGKGCTSGTLAGGDLQTAIPPVRLRAFAEAFAPMGDDGAELVNLFSICDDSYAPAMEAAAQFLVGQIRPGCFPGCVADVASASGLQTDCRVQEVSDSGVVDVVKCAPGPSMPAASDLCYYEIFGAQLDEVCIEGGSNLQIEILRDGPGPVGATLEALCELSDLPGIDCPG